MRWAVLAVLAVLGCGRVDFDPRLDAASGDAAVSARCTGPFAWNAPQPLPALESALDDWAATLSPDNQLLVFSSDRAGNFDLYAATRQGASWSTPIAIAAINDVACADGTPAWNALGTQLYFSRICASSPQLFVASYGFGSFGAPVLVPGLEATMVGGAALSADELEMFYRLFGTGDEIGHATRSSRTAAWTDLGAVPELGIGIGWPGLSADGLTIFVETAGASNHRILGASRPAIGMPFGALATAGDLNDTNASDGDPRMGWDCESIYLDSTRPGSVGAGDIFYATRAN